MEESHTKGLAIHSDPESCVGHREGAGKALTGARTGAVLSRVNKDSGAPIAVHNHVPSNVSTCEASRVCS